MTSGTPLAVRRRALLCTEATGAGGVPVRVLFNAVPSFQVIPPGTVPFV
jgi:hypothetical protein